MREWIREHIEHIGIALLSGIAGVVACLWWTQYVQPREAVDTAARQCMTDQNIDMQGTPHKQVAPQWASCLKQAGKDHGSATLEWIGR